MAKGEAAFGVGGYTHGFAFDETLARTICERLATGETFSSISKDEGMPSRDTIRSWKESHPEFKTAWDDAMLDGCQALLDETLEIADDSSNDYTMGKEGLVLDSEHVQRSKLRIWTRHELIKRKLPKVFGDKLQHGNDPENPLPAPQFIIQPVQPGPAITGDGET